MILLYVLKTAVAPLLEQLSKIKTGLMKVFRLLSIVKIGESEHKDDDLAESTLAA